MQNIISNYPDVLSVDELQQILRIGRSAAYTLLRENTIKTLKVGNRYIIPKQSVIDFLNINQWKILEADMYSCYYTVEYIVRFKERS